MTNTGNTPQGAYLKDGFYKEFKTSIYHPSLSVRDVQEVVQDINYKNIADWSDKKVLRDYTQKGSKGWRRFTIANVVKLKIIFDGRKTGIPIKQINKALEFVCRNTVEVSLINKQRQILAKVKMPSFDYGLLSSIAKNKMCLLIFEGKASIVSAIQAIDYYFNESKGKKPLVLFPIYTYVRQTVAVMLKNDPMIQALSECKIKAS